MKKKIINIIYYLLFIAGLFSCSGQESKKLIKNSSGIIKTSISIIPELFDKQYFHGYQLSHDFNYPIYTHTDTKFGELTVDFINKDIDKQEDWFQYDVKNNLDFGDDPDEKYFTDLNKNIKKNLESDLNQYYIITEYVPAKYIDKTLGYLYPYIKEYYIYNPINKNWKFIKKKTIDDGSNEKNITKLEELNTILNITQTNSIKEESKNESITIELKKIDDIWSSDCNNENHLSISSTLNSVQFTIINRFSMNAQLKKIDTNKYEFYFTDFPPIIPLPDNMQVWDNMDNTKPVGTIKIVNESKLILTWFGFYHKKLKKNIETENPFDKNNLTAVLVPCKSS